jgi:hypothetical protein
VRERAVAIAAVVLVASVFGIWAFVFATYGVDVPIADQWDTPMRQLVLAHDGALGIADLAAQHNEARKVVPTVISLGLARLAGHYDTQLELYVSLAVFATLLAFVAWSLRRMAPAPVAASVVAWLTALAWSAHTSRLHLFSITFERLLPELALVAGLALLAVRGTTWPATLAAIALAAAAQLSFPSGLALWPLFAAGLVALATGPVRAKLGAMLGAGVATALLYFHGFVAPGTGAPLASAVEEPWRVAGFALAFLGNAFTRNLVIGESIALAALAAYGWLAIAHARRGPDAPKRRAERMWLLVGAYSIAQAGLAAAGRLALDSDHATRPDYVVHAIYLYAAIAVLLLLRTPAAHRTAACAALVIAALAWSATLAGHDFWDGLQRRQQARRHARACLLLHRIHWDGACLAALHPAGDLAQRIERATPWLDPEPFDRLVAGDAGTGAVESVRREDGAVALEGWAVRDRAPADAVVIAASADEGAPIVGIAAVAEPRPDVARGVGLRGDRAGWRIRVPLGDAPDSCALAAFALDATHGTLHRLASGENSCERAGAPRG